MEPIDWSALVRAIVSTGIGQQQLARECGCGQTTISDIARGATVEPRAGIALRLLLIARQRSVEVAGLAATLEALAGEPAERLAVGDQDKGCAASVAVSA